MMATRFLTLLLAALLPALLIACGGDDKPAAAIRVSSSGEISLPENGTWLRELETTDAQGTSFTVFALTTEGDQQRVAARRFDRSRGAWGAWETVGDPPSRWTADTPTAVALEDGSILLTWVETHLDSSRIALRSRRWNPSSRLWEAALGVDTGAVQLGAATLVARTGGEAVALWTRRLDDGATTLLWSSLAANDTQWALAQTLIAASSNLGVIQVSAEDGNVALAWLETTTGVPLIRGVQPAALRLIRLAASDTTWSDPAVLSVSGRSAERFVLREFGSTAAVLWTDFSVLDACLKATVTTETTALTQSLACTPGDSPVTGGMALHPFGVGGVTGAWIEEAQPWFSTVAAGQSTWSTPERITSDSLQRWTLWDGTAGPLLTGVTDAAARVLEQQRSTGPWASLSNLSFASTNSRFAEVVAHRGGTAVLWVDATDTASILRASADIGRAAATELGRRSSGLVRLAASANAGGKLAVVSNTTATNGTDGVHVDLHSGRGGSWGRRVRLGDATEASEIDPPVWLGSEGQLLMTWWWQPASAATASRRWAWAR